MKTAKEVQKKLDELEKRKTLSSNMNYEIDGAKQALKWVLSEDKFLNVGYRF